MARITYLELPVADTARTKAFYATAFAWPATDYGPTYAAAMTGGAAIGFQADPDERTAAPLAVIEVEDLDAAQTAVERAGGTITQPVFAFPGGRRFHFADPDGHELAVMQPD
jgi:predicted enzyme related to lactoylglutathione lyase